MSEKAIFEAKSKTENMKKAYVFPGQGSQFPGMAKDLYEKYETARQLMEQANEILGFRITDVMFAGTEEDLKQTKVTQPAIFLHSVVLARVLGDKFQPDMVAGHSLGEFSALVAAGALSFEDGLTLVSKRAIAMQKACELAPSTMAAILGLDDDVVVQVCNEIEDTVVAANFNNPGQVVISGSIEGVDKAVEALKQKGARRAIKLQVSGGFHSPFMKPAEEELAQAINETKFTEPMCPVYQNVDAKPHVDPAEIKQNLLRQLTSPVLWTQTIRNMIADGAGEFIEVGPGNVLQGMIRKIDRSVKLAAASQMLV